jgi:hypothetical protein
MDTGGAIMTTAPLKPPKLTQFQINVLNIVAQAATRDRAIGDIRDWLRCNRKEAEQHISDAQRAAKRIEEMTT